MRNIDPNTTSTPPRPARYWRSLEELAGDSAFFARLADEFPPEAGQWLDETSRRNFLKIMGASLALAGVVGCDDLPEEKILPYVNQPKQVVPGKPSFYSTAFAWNGYGIGALVESHEGRPTKIEGNPGHPSSLGASNIFMQASVLDLYDPDRSKLVTRAGVAASWGTFVTELRSRLDRHRQNGAGLRLLTRNLTSPTIIAQINEFRQIYPGAKWHVHDPTARAGCSSRNGGAGGQAVYDFSKASVILSLDGDFLFSDVGSLAYARQFMSRRRREPGLDPQQQKMNRLYVVESSFTLTGGAADHRIAVAPSRMLEIAKAIAAALGAGPTAPTPTGLGTFIKAVVDDLRGAGSATPQRPAGAPDAAVSSSVMGGVVVAGDAHPPELQAIVRSINQALGAVGRAVRYIPPIDAVRAESLAELAADMAAGAVDSLLILGGNPVYDAPADIPFRQELARLSIRTTSSGDLAHFTAHLGVHDDETSFSCQWHVPESHYLESWGDLRCHDGTAAIVQPLILPLYPASRSAIELMETLLDRPDRSAYEAVRATWWGKIKTPGTADASAPSRSAASQPGAAAPTTPPPPELANASAFEIAWKNALRSGVLTEITPPAAEASAESSPTGQPSVQLPGARSANSPPAMASSSAAAQGAPSWELVFLPDPGVWDGQSANNGWLQELPRPFTKLVWDNAALLGYRDARRLGLADRSLIRIELDGRSIDAPVLIVPGLPDGVLTLTFGYGRSRGGAVALDPTGKPRGYNAYALGPSAAPGFAKGAVVTPLHGRGADLVLTRSHHAMAALPGLAARDAKYDLTPNAIATPGESEEHLETDNRRIVRSANLADFKSDPNFVTRLGGEKELAEKGLAETLPGRRIHLTLYPTNKADGGWDYTQGFQWGMSIDATACIGCNACVVACQAENNIPVVGKDQCSRQREMHWIRIDDWFGAQPGADPATGLDNPQVTHMPVPCQHCENAPCEVVCPVGATTHSPEGINEMTYNRCIGTRYCSNNCPYKVRRFNFLLYSDFKDPCRALQYNPEVTVRSRGVMEKCNYCVQRINNTRIEIEKTIVRLEEQARQIEHDDPGRAARLRNESTTVGRKLLEQLQTACQQACPTQAIIFGNKADEQSQVAKLKADPLDYTLLFDLTTQPRTSYMARLRNPNALLGEGHV